MKLLPKQPRVANTEDSVGLGIEAAVIIALFLGLGYVLDRIFDTTPVFMIIMTLVGAIGLFAKLKYRYDDRMNELEAERRASTASAATSRRRGAA
jgi:Putative F0F1-ATPase subunit Ca2+/Mg2+ transporter